MSSINIINVLEKAVEGDLLSQAFITSVIAYAASESESGEWKVFDCIKDDAKLTTEQLAEYFEAMIEAAREVQIFGGFDAMLESVLKYASDDE
jgi:hypothetical protein